jgi:type IV secretion system protein VirB1
MALAQTCAPAVHPTTMAAVMRVESSFNPYAIGVVGGRLERQPANKAEAVATAEALEKAGYNFSLGAAQVNRYNLARYNLTYATAFDPCESVRAGGGILKECYDRAKPAFKDEQQALQAAFSCYYSGNFSTGLKPDFPGQPSYVQKVLNSAAATTGEVPKVQAIPVIRTASAKSPTKPVGREPGSTGAGTTSTGVISIGEAEKPSSSVMVYQ